MKQFQKVFKRKWCGCDIERSFMKGRDLSSVIKWAQQTSVCAPYKFILE